jgi:maleate isomerase
MIRAVAAEGADAIVILCTNLDGAALAATLERELDIAVLDSVAVTLWRSLGLAGGDVRTLAQWGRIFQTMPAIK